MASRHIRIITASAALALAGGYGLYLATAQNAPPELAQAPLNVEVQIPPAFIMALDDSGSMIWETLNNTRDGVFGWNDTQSSFYNGSTPYGYAGVNERFYYAFPSYGRGNAAIPPIDAFGFARSPDVNPAYFDPRVEYPTWKNANRSDFLVIDPSNAPLDPRPDGSPGKIAGSLNLTQNSENSSTNWRFRVRSGMLLPVDTWVYGTCNSTPGLPTGSGSNWRRITQDTRITANCDLGIRYYPATFFLEDPSTLPATYGYVASPVAVANPPGGRPGTLYKYEITLANFGNDEVKYNAAMQNFANWFSFYRTRREALIGAATNALLDTNNLRVGWFRIHNRVDVTMRDMSDLNAKSALYNEIITQMRASSSTPNRRAVRWLGEQFKRTDDNAPIQLSCQKNAGMLFTDGYINEEGNSPNVGGNLDGTRMPMAPFSDSVQNTMADIVVPYYLDSLRPDRETNSVPVPDACAVANPDPRLDCQTNLHMNFYGVTLGTEGHLYGTTYLPIPAKPWIVTPDPFVTTPNWHGSREDLSPHAVDEMWHATINSRGEMINATRPSDITAAIRRILASVGEGDTPSGTIGLTGSRIGPGSLTVQPSYFSTNHGTDWYSILTAETVTADPYTGQTSFTEVWEASSKLAEQSQRDTIRFGRTGNSVQPTVADFTANNVTLEDLCAGRLSFCTAEEIEGLAGGTNTARAVAYLSGDRSSESGLRTRTSLLGDIVNSSPVVSSPTDDYGYRALGGTLGSSYAEYLADKKETNRPMVYVGANDGMFHAFDGRTTDEGGFERFAYIPATALGHMGNLLFPYREEDRNDQKFRHRYYVDGPVTVSDALIDGTWKTVAVGTTGAGGRSVFALDVTNPDGIEVLWEINDLIQGNADITNNIGHVLGKPVIVPVRIGNDVSWKVVFGNGYNSISQRASLFVVDLGSGDVAVIPAAESVTPALPYNGLGNVVAVDRKRYQGNAVFGGRDGYADTVYAADQNGAVWKFDLLNESVALGGQPLFVARDAAGNRQPITGGLTAAAGPGGGVMLYFGTGSFSFNGDKDRSGQQTIYGILDRDQAVSGRDQLLQQTVGEDAGNFRATSTNSMISGRRGWYLDLPPNERFVGYPRIESGIVFFPSYEPSAGEEVGCSVNGTNWLYGLNALSGGAALSQVRIGSPAGTPPASATGAVALNSDGAPVKDVGVFTTPRLTPLEAGASDEDVAAALGAQCSMVVQVAGAPALYLPRPCGRQSWRQVR